MDLYRKIAERETSAQKWNDLPDATRQNYIKLAQGCIASVTLHNADEKELAHYLAQYVNFKEDN